MWKTYISVLSGSEILRCSKMVRVLIVPLPIHVMKRAPEQTIHRKSEGDNKSERKR